jgi:hypothetical protein
MVMGVMRALRLGTVSLVALLLGLGLGCAGQLAAPLHYDYFGRPSADDAWSPKIAGWQRRERADADDASAAAPPVGGSADAAGPAGAGEPAGEDLRAKYLLFRAERKRATARDFAEWIQSEAKTHYIADGPIDHWATLEETLRSNGDDCDGLELLVYRALRDLGFGENEVFRSIVYRPSDGQHHMVTLWFEDPADPWVIDPTGAMIHGMRRMSQVPDWVPLKVFGDSEEYTVRRTRAPAAALVAHTP